MAVAREHVLDMHGKTVAQALEQLEGVWRGEAASASPRAIRVIHGYGSTGVGGDIRDAVRAHCLASRDALSMLAGEDGDGNPGVTVIRVLAPLDGLRALAAAIERFCRKAARTKAVVERRFSERHGATMVREAIGLLRREGRVVRARKGRVWVFRAPHH